MRLRTEALNRETGYTRTLTLVLLATTALVLAAGTARAFGDSPAPDVTSTKTSPNSGPVPLGNAMTVTALVKDIGGNPGVPTGSVSWDDGGAGGKIIPNTCVLNPAGGFLAQCSVSYTAPAGSLGSAITLTASYSGDPSHLSSTGQSTLTVFLPAVLTISPSSVSATEAKPVTFTGTVTDTSGAPNNTPRGTLSWSDGGVGGTFTSATCALASTIPGSGSCSVKYHGPVGATGAFTITINATYSGDSSHAPSSATAKMIFTQAFAPMTVNFVIMGSSKGAVPPIFTYSNSNVTHAVALTAASATYQVDVSSVWFVPNQLGNSTQGEAWNLYGGPQGFNTFSSGTSITFVYWHQYLVNLGYQIVGGTAGASVPPFVTWTSFGVTRQTGAPGQTWVDVGTAYAYSALLPGSFGDVRWLAQNVSGTATRSADYSAIYYHQYHISVAFAVRDSPKTPAAPSFFAYSMGLRFNSSFALLNSKMWLDAGSQYSVTDPLDGGNSTVHWSAGSSAAGLVTASDISINYYRQYALTASFKMTDNSAPAQVIKGVSTPVIPSLSGLSGGLNVNVPLGTQPQTVWLDSGSSYTISKSLLVLPSEKWIATGDVSGKVVLGATVFQTYYHEYLLRLSYSQGGASSSSAPSITYTLLGAQASSPITTQGSTIWADGGTRFFVADALAGDRWFAPSTPDGFASSANMTVTYYHQYMVNVSLKVGQGDLPAQSSISGTSGGRQVKQLLSTESQTVWLDSGTSYSIPQTLLGLTNERWVASSDVSGTLTSPATITLEFYHQVLLNVSSSGFPPAQKPLASYKSFGANATTSLVLAGSGIWADVGTTFSVQNAINGTAGERWYSGFPAVDLTGPFQAKVQYFHQYLVSYDFTASGGPMNVPPAINGAMGGKNSSETISSKGGQVWLDSGSNWRVTLPAGIQDFRGMKWQSSSPNQGTIGAPTTVSFSYFLQYLVTTAASPASGGAVTPGGWYNASSSITLQASPGQGWTLAGWKGAGPGAYSGGNATFSISVVSGINETAQFAPRLTVISSNGGSVKFTTGTAFQSVNAGQSVQTFVAANGTVTLQASSSFPYLFVKWSGVDGGNSNRVTVNLNGPTQIEAVFAPSYVDLIGIPGAVFASALTLYLARRPILSSGRQVVRDIKRALSS